MSDNDYKTYLFSYYHKGSWWSLEIQAESEEDAKERVQKLPWAKYDGVLMMVLPCSWMARLMCRIGNFLSDTKQDV